MGKSRSASIIIAYLLSTDRKATPSSALEQLRQARPFAEPNDGFMSQLELFTRMQCPPNLDVKPDYQRWLYQRAVRMSNSAGVAPDPTDVFKVVHKEPTRTPQANDPSTPQAQPRDHGIATLSVESASDLGAKPKCQSTFRCRWCRKRLATSNFVIDHKSKTLHGSPKDIKPSCAHVFVDPLSWMKPELEKGSLSGRFECPNSKCKQNVGRYAWQGMKCSCGEWVVPGLSLMRSKLDEVEEDGTRSPLD